MTDGFNKLDTAPSITNIDKHFKESQQRYKTIQSNAQYYHHKHHPNATLLNKG